VCRILCVLFALCGLLPVGLGMLVRTKWAKAIATTETRKALSDMGIQATFDLELRLWPLSVGTKNLEIASTDGKGPFLVAKNASAKPKIFGLLAGKLVIDEIEIDKPEARVVVKDGKIANLALNLPEQKRAASTRPPFEVVSASEADVDLDVDGTKLRLHQIDADVTTDDDGAGGNAFEIAVRATEGDVRTVTQPEPGVSAISEDVFCRVDARARIEPKRILVRRLSAYGALDLGFGEGTGGDCSIAKSDKRYAELSIGHLDVELKKSIFESAPSFEDSPPSLDGHIRARAPLAVIDRFPDAPEVDGWVAVDVDVRYTAASNLPDMIGTIDANGVRVTHYSFARTFHSDFVVRRNIFTSALTRLEIADGVAELRDIEVRPFEKGVPAKVGRLDVRDVAFTSLMKDLGVAKHPHVTWDLREVHVQNAKGTISPLHIDGDLQAKTTNFAVYDDWVQSPTKTRATGVARGDIVGKVAIRPTALEFHNVTVTTPKGRVGPGVLVSLGYHEILRVEAPVGKVDLSDLSPLGSVDMAGVADLKALVTGPFADPHIEGDLSIQGFALGDPKSPLAFGNVKDAHVTFEDLVVLVRDAHVQKGKSTFEMPTGRLDFGGPASMKMDGSIATKNLDLRDFFDVFNLDEDPRFTDIHGVLEANARMHLALGGPEDVCKGGFLDVQATATAHDLDLLGEKFDEGQADLEYRWIDRQAGIDGAEIDVRSIALSKLKKAGRAPVGSILGSLSVHRGGQLRGSVVVQGYPLSRVDMLGPAKSALEGSASGIASIGGTLSAFDVQADLDVGAMRIGGAPFGGSSLHVGMTQTPTPPKVTGKTPCGAPITKEFDKDAYLRDLDRTVQGKYTLDGKLFGGQVKLEGVEITRQKWPVVTGRVALDRFDLAPVARLVAPPADDAEPTTPLGGTVSGDVEVTRVATNDLAHAKVRFTPRELRVGRGAQKIELRTPPKDQPPIVFALADDEVVFPPVTFDLSAPNGFKGAVGVKGAVRKVTQGGDLGLEAELSPIDLGILVGIVPRVTRAAGTLTGSLKVTGKASAPVLAGQLAVRRGELGVKGLPGNLTDVELDVVADENEARITRGTGHFLGGDVSVTGRMPLKGGQLGVAEAELVGRQLFIAPIEGVKATVDADLRVTLNPQATTAASRLPFVGGDVTITSFEYTKPITLELNGIAGGAKRTVVEAYDPSLDVVALGFDVRSRVPLRIRNNLVEASLEIDPRGIHVSGTNQRIGLRGELTGRPGGRFRVFANDFEIQKASIRFDDPTRIVPHLDITAVTEYRRYSSLSAGQSTANTQGSAAVTSGGLSSGGAAGSKWRITLHAYGDVDSVQVDMTSDPPLSREDIFFLLTIGLTRAEVDQVQAGSVYASAAFEAIGTVSGVDRAVKQAIPVIDDFRPGTAYSPRTGRVEPNITVGRRLTDNVRARLTSGLAEDPQLRSSIEWRLNRSLTVEPSYDRINTASSSNVGNFGVDFRWRLEFD
jgi:translocation and assembly module TamB